MTEWDAQRARETYNVAHWSDGYFDVNSAGHVVALPNRDRTRPGIELHQVAHAARERGLTLPLLMRFVDILYDRVDALRDAFASAMERLAYSGKYTAVYPIKVNQQRRVVEAILERGNGGVGLEAGSKPELMAVLGRVPPGGIVICNGYKDREYIRLALRGLQLGLKVYLVVEKSSEIELILEESAALGVLPLLGLRVRLASIGAGKWQNTGGEKSKFGLSAAQALHLVERLRAENRLDSLRLLHFHLGSQIPHIGDIQRGMREAARYYAELRALGVPVDTVDVGGGLGVDYEGTRSRSFSSMNYSVREYAQNVIHALHDVCQQHELPHPDVISESGRALTAHHAVLVTNVIDVDRVPEAEAAEPPEPDDPPILHDLWEAMTGIARRSAVEVYHDVHHWVTEVQTMYTHGLVSLAQRARAEGIYQAACRRLLTRLNPRLRAHRELLDELNEKLADKLFCNFSLFQSLPDVWALKQIFPVLPLQRLDEPAERRNVLQDLTCDSDGSIGAYVDEEGIEATVPLPAYHEGEEYLLGMFMVGAYQEILGDRHNLFGATDAVNVELTDEGYVLTDPVHGDTVATVLRSVQFDPEELTERYRERVAASPLSATERQRCMEELEAGLQGYTYFEAG